MKPYAHQEEIATQGYQILKSKALVYLAMEERTGKTLTSILIAEMSLAKNVLVLTKKKALGGWHETLEAFKHKKNYTVTNYHQSHKLKPIYDLVILDEAHSYMSAYPKVGKMWKDVAKLTLKRPIIYLSATPYAQGYQLLYHQLRLSFWSPYRKYRDFYRWHNVYGIPDKTRTPYGLIETYKKVKDSAFTVVEHLFITKTRAELDFAQEPTDVLKHIELSAETKKLYNSCMKSEMLKIPAKDILVPLDSPMRLRTTLHMLEGGVAKVDDKYIVLDNNEKIEAILNDFKDTEDLCIMYQYIAEGIKLKKHFKRAIILQGTSYAEGVDLSHISSLVIYSQDFSTAKHSQRRARQANKKREKPIEVTFYLVKKAISEQVYNTVSVNKTNFIDKLFTRNSL